MTRGELLMDQNFSLVEVLYGVPPYGERGREGERRERERSCESATSSSSSCYDIIPLSPGPYLTYLPDV